MALGCRKDSIVQVAYGYGLYSGLGLHQAASRLEAGDSDVERQYPTATHHDRELGTTVLCCTPSMLLFWARPLAIWESFRN